MTKNFKVEIRLSQEDFEKLNRLSSDRTYLRSSDVNMGFTSRAEYLEFLINTTNKMTAEQWKYFVSTYGAHFKEKMR